MLVCWAPAYPTSPQCWMPWRRGCRRKATVVLFPYIFLWTFFWGCVPLDLVLVLSLTHPHLLASLLFIIFLSEWDWLHPHDFSVLPYMLMIPSVCNWSSFVLRLFSVIKRHFKPSVLKVNLTIVTPQFLLRLLYLLLSLLYLSFSLIISFCPEPKLRSHPRFFLALCPSMWTIF